MRRTHCAQGRGGAAASPCRFWTEQTVDRRKRLSHLGKHGWRLQQMMMRALLAMSGLMAVGLHAENGSAAWLRYAPVAAPVPLPAAIASFGGSGLIANARNEVVRGVRGMTGRTLRSAAGLPSEAAIL